MKKKTGILFFFAVVLFSASCGGDDEKEAPVRIGKPGTIFEGPVGGRDRYVFVEGDSVSVIVSGTMRVEIPKGIFKGTAFPADVSYSVRASGGGLIQGAVSFPRLFIDNNGLFQGDVSSETAVASILGVYSSDTTSASIDVQGFSARVPTTGATVKQRTVILQGQLNVKKFETQ